MKRRSYPSDLSAQEWTLLDLLIPPAKPGAHPHATDMREVINAILYLDRAGCQWRAFPHEFPPGRRCGATTALGEQVCVKVGRQPTPSAAIIDSQSVKTTQKGGLAAMMAEKR